MTYDGPEVNNSQWFIPDGPDKGSYLMDLTRSRSTPKVGICCLTRRPAVPADPGLLPGGVAWSWLASKVTEERLWLQHIQVEGVETMRLE